MGTHPIFESDFDCLTEMDRLLYSSLSSTGRKLISTKVQSDLKQKSIEDKIQLFPLGISPTQIRYAVIPISSSEYDILNEYKQYDDRSVRVCVAVWSATASSTIFLTNKVEGRFFKRIFKDKGWTPAFYGAVCLFAYMLNVLRQQVVKVKLNEFIPSEDNKEIFNYPKMAMTREDLYDKTLSLEDQIQYFKSHEDELERRIIMLLESDTFFFTSLTELDMKALSWDEIEKDQNISFIAFNKYLEDILDEINTK